MVKFAAILIGFTLALSAQAAPKKSSKIQGHKSIMSYSDFKKLSPQLQKKYITEIQRVFYEWEKTMARFYPVVENKIQIPLFFEIAEAGWQGEKCVVGGIETGLVGGKCPTRNSRCDASANISDSFKCGAIFGSVCIERNPISNLSERCFNKAKDQNVKPTAEVLQAAEKLHADICKDGNEDIDGCQILTRQLDAVKAAILAGNGGGNNGGGNGTGTTTGTTTDPTRPPRTDDPNDPAVRDAIAPSSDTSCYEASDSKKCTPGAVTLGAVDGKVNIFQCVKHDANQPEAYRHRADALRFKRFIDENKTNPIVRNGLAAWGMTIDEALNGLGGLISSGIPVFDFRDQLPANRRESGKALLEFYNKEANLCEAILKNRNEATNADARNAARKPINIDDLKKAAEFNEDYKGKFSEACKTSGKSPQAKAAQIFHMEGNPPVEKVWDTGFPVKVTTGTGIFEGYQVFTFVRGTTPVEYALKKDPQTGKYLMKDVVDCDANSGDGGTCYDDYKVDVRTVHRDDVNITRVPANATGESTCDSFREGTSNGSGAGSGGSRTGQ